MAKRNPVLEAFILGSQEKQRDDEFKARQKLAEAEQKSQEEARKAHIEQQQEIINLRKAEAQRELETQSARAEFAARQGVFEGNVPVTGGISAEQIGQITGLGSSPETEKFFGGTKKVSTPFGDVQMTGQEFESVSEQGKQKRVRELVEALQLAAGKEKIDIQSELLKAEATEKSKQADRESRERVAQMQKEGRINAASINAASRKEVALLKEELKKKSGDATTKEGIDTFVDQAYFGQTDFPTNDAGIKLASRFKEKYPDTNPIKTKTAAKVQELVGSRQILNEMKAFADKYRKLFPETIEKAAFVKNFEELKNALGVSEAIKDLEALQGKAAEIARLHGESGGRLSDQDITRTIATMLQFGITSDQANERIYNLDQRLRNTANSLLINQSSEHKRKAFPQLFDTLEDIEISTNLDAEEADIDKLLEQTEATIAEIEAQ